MHVAPQEQVARGIAQPVGDPALRQVVRPVMQHVAALAERAQVGEAVVTGVAVQMGSSQYDAGGPKPCHLDQVGPASRTTAPVTPGCRLIVEPAPIGQAADLRQVRPAAALASTTGTLEAHTPAQLAPVSRVKST